ncbi:MAG: hypothetical protein ACYCV4_02060 [Dermatophilaceae bacterium]
MSLTPLIAPTVTTYAAQAPYITVNEFIQSPTGVDIAQLVPRGTVTQQQDMLSILIQRASSWADSLCYQVLGATVDITSSRCRITRDQTVRILAPNTPVLEVRSVSLGWTPSSLVEISQAQLSASWIDRKTVTVPVYGMSTPAVDYSTMLGGRSDGKIYVSMTYVNGYANTLLADATIAGASSVTVVDPTGIYPGLDLILYDAGQYEQFEVASGYALGSTTVPAVSPLVYAHAAGVSISSLPAAVKQAVISLTCALIRQRGAAATVMSSMRGQPSKAPASDMGMEDLAVAVDLLEPFRRVA